MINDRTVQQDSAARVVLTPNEWRFAVDTALSINEFANINGLKHNYDASNDDTFDMSIIGCAGELAVAKYFNVFWAGKVGDIQSFDVAGIDVEVRATQHLLGKLILHPRATEETKGDKADTPYVLAVYVQPTASIQKHMFRLPGWILSDDAWNTFEFKDHFQTKRPCYAIAQGHLRPMPELKTFIRQRKMKLRG